jgi:hypothetical protein
MPPRAQVEPQTRALPKPTQPDSALAAQSVVWSVDFTTTFEPNAVALVRPEFLSSELVIETISLRSSTETL